LYNAPGRAVSPVTTGAALFSPYSHECVLHMATEWARVDEGGAEALDDWLAVHPDAGLVVVDILKVVRPSVSGNRGIYDADYEALQSMQSAKGCAPVAVVEAVQSVFPIGRRFSRS
jgi:hypothetical protein